MSKWPIGVFTSIDAGLGVHLDVAAERYCFHALRVAELQRDPSGRRPVQAAHDDRVLLDGDDLDDRLVQELALEQEIGRRRQGLAREDDARRDLAVII